MGFVASSPREEEAPRPVAMAAAGAAGSGVTLVETPLDRIIDWMPDDDSLVCIACNKAFTFKRRRHHCRSCGILVCYKCGPKRLSRLIDGLHRTCPKCCPGGDGTANASGASLSAPPAAAASAVQASTSAPLSKAAPAPATPTPAPAPAPAPAKVAAEQQASVASGTNAKQLPQAAAPHTHSAHLSPATPTPQSQSAAAVLPTTPSQTTPQLKCVFEHGAHVRDTPSKSAKLIGEIDYGEMAAGTGKSHCEMHGLMYVELCRSPQHPQGGWVPVCVHSGHPVMEEVETDAATAISEMPSPSPLKKSKSILRYRCCFEYGAHVRDTPSHTAVNIGEIDEGHVVVVTGKVHTEHNRHGKGGITFIEMEASTAHPHGGWVPLVSKHGHTVMEPFSGDA